MNHIQLDPIWTARVNRVLEAVEGLTGPGVLRGPNGSISINWPQSAQPAAPQAGGEGLTAPQYEGDIFFGIVPNTSGWALGYAVNVIPSF